jgi:hypothetical protein
LFILLFFSLNVNFTGENRKWGKSI